jgi:hypothetical protein
MTIKWIMLSFLTLLLSFDRGSAKEGGRIEIGVSRVDITPIILFV